MDYLITYLDRAVSAGPDAQALALEYFERLSKIVPHVITSTRDRVKYKTYKIYIF